MKSIFTTTLIAFLFSFSLTTTVAAADQTAAFAGGCFWGVEAVFEHVKGVKSVVSGYTGGSGSTANYEEVSGGETEHAESVKILFDPAQVSYQQLLFVFFSVAHDPTQFNMQGPDHGRQYRSAIFYTDETQRKAALDFIKAVDASKALTSAVVTEVVPLKAFYNAEEYHQNYMRKNPNDPYIIVNDKPKVDALKQKFPDLYTNQK